MQSAAKPSSGTVVGKAHRSPIIPNVLIHPIASQSLRVTLS